MADLYQTANPAGSYPNSPEVEMVTGNPDFDKYLSTLSTEEKQKAIDAYNAPATGEELNNMLQQKNAQGEVFEMKPDEYNTWKEFRKNQETHILEGMGEAGLAVLGDFQKAVGAVADHPLTAFAKAAPSTIEALAQGTRNLYGMLGQSSDPNSVLFKIKNALTADGSDPQAEYKQFLDAQRFNIHSANLASGKETIIMDKDVIDHDMTQAMSYIADPTLFIPFGEFASAGMKAVGMGEKLAAASAKASAIKAAVIGGSLKMAGGSLELVGGLVRGTIDKSIETAGNIFEGATGISAKEANATLKASAIPVTAASFAGHSIPVASDIGKVYVAGSTMKGFGEAVRTVGEQIMKQEGRRGALSFAAQSLIDAQESGIALSSHAKGILNVFNAADPIFSYGAAIGGGMTHGAIIGGGLGYLSGEGEGMAHGIGAGMALGGVGALGGRMYADVAGGTRLQRMMTQGQFAMDYYKANSPDKAQFWGKVLADAHASGDMNKVNAAYAHIGSIDVIAGDYTADIHYSDKAYQDAIKARGYDPETGKPIDPKTGEVQLDANGKPMPRMASLKEFQSTDGFTVINKDGKVHLVINGSKPWGDVLPHELFHTIMRTTQMYDKFMQDWSSHLFGKYGTDGTQLEKAKVDPEEFRQFHKRYMADLPAGPQRDAAMKMADIVHDEWKKANGDFGQMMKNNPEAANSLRRMSEEFAAYYYTQWIKGKPLDYLFHGGKLPTIRGAMDNIQNRFLDFWTNRINKEAPSFDFSNAKNLDAAFSGGKGGKRVRVPALDMALQDLIRMQSQTRSRTSGIPIVEMSPKSRLEWVKNNGVDGLLHAIDPVTGQFKGIDKAQQEKWRKQNAVDVVNALNRLHGKNADSYSGPLSEEQLTHLVKEGVWSQAFADRIKSFQEAISDPTKQNTFHHQYHGQSHEVDVQGNRVYGGAVPVTDRITIPVSMEMMFGKDGTFKANLLSVDKKVLDTRINEQWAKPEVQQLWGGNREDMVADYVKYVNNMSAPADKRVPSSVLLEDGRGNGARMRDVFHQMTGVAKAGRYKYFNAPTADIIRPKVSTVQNLSMDLMSPLTVDTAAPRLNFTEDSVVDHSRNFHVSGMKEEDAPNGKIYTHELGYKFGVDKNGKTSVFTPDGSKIGVFQDARAAETATQRYHDAQVAKIPADIEKGNKIQQEFQGNFHVFSDKTFSEAHEKGDIAKTQEGMEFIGKTKWIPQTREEFVLGNLIKLRQGNPNDAVAIFKAGYDRYVQLENALVELKKNKKAAFDSGNHALEDAFVEKIEDTRALMNKLSTIHTLYGTAEATNVSNKDLGKDLISFINKMRVNGESYYHLAEGLFGDLHNSQFKTGEGFTTVATHGTNSPDTVKDGRFKASELGSRHGSVYDQQGVFLAGSSRTSFNYSDSFNGKSTEYIQVRAMTKMENPLVVDMKHGVYDTDTYNKLFKQAKEGNHDGIVIKNVQDGAPSDTIFIVLNDKIDNNTAFLDSHIGTVRPVVSPEGDITPHIRHPIQASTPRGDVLTGRDVGLSWHKSGEAEGEPRQLPWKDMFYSPLKRTVNKILDETTGNSQSIKASRLINLIKNASGGDVGRIITEADAIGLTDFLKEKGQKIIPIQEVKDFIEKNGIRVTMNEDTTDVQADFGDTREYIAKPWNPKGNRSDNYHTLLVGINPEHSHGVTGHFGEQLVHVRGTVRVDAEGKRVFHVEEIQPQNSNAGVLSESERESAKTTADKLRKYMAGVSEETWKKDREVEAKIKSHEELINGFTSFAPENADGVDYHLKRLESWFDPSRTDVEGANPSLKHEMMEVINNGIIQYNKRLSSGEKVPTGIYSPSEIHAKLRTYNPDKHGWIPSYYREAIHFGITDWAVFVERAKEGKLTTAEKEKYPELAGQFDKYKQMKKEISDRVKSELRAILSKDEAPKAYEYELLGPNYAKYRLQELEYAINKRANDKPLQDFAETTKLASRAIMRKAVELGVDRVSFVRAEDTHPDVQMRNERGRQLYDKAIPEIVNGELKKYGTKLKASNNEGKSQAYPSSDVHDEHTMLAKSLGYDITSKMAEDVMAGQPHFHTSGEAEGEPIIRLSGRQKVIDLSRVNGEQFEESKPISTSFVGRYAKENPELIKGVSLKFGDSKIVSPEIASEAPNLALFKNGEYVGGISYRINPEGTRARIQFARIDSAYRGEKYGNLMYSELIERLRQMGVREVTGTVTDEKGRPISIRRNIIDDINKRTGFPVTRVIEEGSGDRYVSSPLDQSAYYHKSGEKDQTPKIGKFKVPAKVKAGISALQDAIYSQADTDKVPDKIKSGLKALQEAVRKQDATDEVPVKEVKKSFKELREQILSEQGNVATNQELMAGLKKLIESAKFADLADAPLPKAGGTPQARAAGWKALAGAVEQAGGKSKPVKSKPVTGGTLTPSEADNTTAKAAYKQPKTPEQVREAAQPQPEPQTAPEPTPEAPEQPSEPTPDTQSPFRVWRSENGPNGSIWSNIKGYTIMVQGDKFKVYNPYKAVIGIYNNLDQAKRRVQREEPKR